MRGNCGWFLSNVIWLDTSLQWGALYCSTCLFDELRLLSIEGRIWLEFTRLSWISLACDELWYKVACKACYLCELAFESEELEPILGTLISVVIFFVVVLMPLVKVMALLRAVD